jgi:hypothetical protein
MIPHSTALSRQPFPAGRNRQYVLPMAWKEPDRVQYEGGTGMATCGTSRISYRKVIVSLSCACWTALKSQTRVTLCKALQTILVLYHTKSVRHDRGISRKGVHRTSDVLHQSHGHVWTLDWCPQLQRHRCFTAVSCGTLRAHYRVRSQSTGEESRFFVP